MSLKLVHLLNSSIKLHEYFMKIAKFCTFPMINKHTFTVYNFHSLLKTLYAKLNDDVCTLYFKLGSNSFILFFVLSLKLIDLWWLLMMGCFCPVKNDKKKCAAPEYGFLWPWHKITIARCKNASVRLTIAWIVYYILSIY